MSRPFRRLLVGEDDEVNGELKRGECLEYREIAANLLFSQFFLAAAKGGLLPWTILGSLSELRPLFVYLKFMKKVSFLAMLTFSAAGAISAQAAVIVASKNSYVTDGSFANDVRDTSAELKIAARGTDFNRKSYFRFDLSSITSGAISGAALNLRLRPSHLIGPTSGNVTTRIFGVVSNGGDFDPTTITWNNAPFNNATTNSFDNVGTQVLDLATVVIDSTTVAGGESISWASASLDTFLNSSAGGGVTLMAVSDGGASDPGFSFLSLASGDSTAGTTPSLSFTVVPEPSTTALGGGALAFGLLVRRRKKSQK